MKFVIYEEDTNKIACIFDFNEFEVLTYSRYNIREYDDDIEPVMETKLKTNNTFLIQNSFILMPECEEIYNEEDDDE